MWISRGDDFLNLTDEEYNILLKDAWNKMDSEEKKEYKNNFMKFKLEMEEDDEEFFHLDDSLLQKFEELREKFSGTEISDEQLREITSLKGIKISKEEDFTTIYLDDASLDEEAREQLNWEYSFDVIVLEKK
jgi:hypothetical protein